MGALLSSVVMRMNIMKKERRNGESTCMPILSTSRSSCLFILKMCEMALHAETPAMSFSACSMSVGFRYPKTCREDEPSLLAAVLYEKAKEKRKKQAHLVPAILLPSASSVSSTGLQWVSWGESHRHGNRWWWTWCR